MQGILVILSFELLNAFVCSSVRTHLFCFFTKLLSVFVEKFSMYLCRYCIAPNNDFSSICVFGYVDFLVASSLSCNSRTPRLFILCPTNFVVFLKILHFCVLSL